MLIVGLTGGIGSGKSTIAQLFAEKDIPIIDADVIARSLTEPNQPALQKIIEHFGPAIIASSGHLDRKKLRELIFQHQKERIWLENLLHPLIREEIKNQVNTLSSPYCIVVIPLLLDDHTYDFLNRILVVDTEPHLQITRTSQRDKTDKKSIKAIINVQINRSDRLKMADDLILNNSTLTHLKQEVDKLHQLYLTLSQKI